jgi:hypothetical protein
MYSVITHFENRMIYCVNVGLPKSADGDASANLQSDYILPETLEIVYARW